MFLYIHIIEKIKNALSSKNNNLNENPLEKELLTNNLDKYEMKSNKWLYKLFY